MYMVRTPKDDRGIVVFVKDQEKLRKEKGEKVLRRVLEIKV